MLGEKFANFNEFYNGHERTERLWLSFCDWVTMVPGHYFQLLTHWLPQSATAECGRVNTARARTPHPVVIRARCMPPSSILIQSVGRSVGPTRQSVRPLVQLASDHCKRRLRCAFGSRSPAFGSACCEVSISDRLRQRSRCNSRRSS